MCRHGDRVKIRIGDKEQDVDRCLAPIIKALNEGGIKTAMSCCGHGEHDGFILCADEDKYRLLIVVSEEESLERFEKEFRRVAEYFERRGKAR